MTRWSTAPVAGRPESRGADGRRVPRRVAAGSSPGGRDSGVEPPLEGGLAMGFGDAGTPQLIGDEQQDDHARR